MKTMRNSLATGAMVAVMALPLAAFAHDDPYGLIDYKMGIAQPVTGEAPVTDTNALPDGNVHGNEGYSVADLRSGAAQPIVTSDGSNALPADTQMKKSAGIAENKSEAGAKGAVISADNAAVGRIERMVPGKTTDRLFVRLSDTLHSPVSQFQIDVPKGAVHDGQVRLSMTLSDLLAHLENRG